MEVEPLKNGQVNQQSRRRPSSADAETRTTHGFFPSQMLGLAASQSSAKTRGSSLRPTPNSYHFNGTNGSTAPAGKSRARFAWDLPRLVRPLAVRKQPCLRSPKLLPHYPAVVEFVYNSRFATAAQVQRRFPQHLASLRTAQYQLSNLVLLGLLRTAPVRSTGPHFPFVYYVPSRGVRLIKDMYASLGRTWDGKEAPPRSSGASLNSLLHELLLTEFDLAVLATTENRGDLTRLFTERRYFNVDRQLRFEVAGKVQRIIPDAGFLIRTASHPGVPPRHLLHFVELDNGSMSLRRLEDKFRLYARWFASAEAVDYLRGIGRRHGMPYEPGCRLLLLARADNGRDDRERILDTVISTLALPSAARERIWITSMERLQNVDSSSAPLTQPIWMRVRDARTWLAQYRALTGNLATGRRHQITRAYVKSQLESMPNHSLLPAETRV